MSEVVSAYTHGDDETQSISANEPGLYYGGALRGALSRATRTTASSAATARPSRPRRSRRGCQRSGSRSRRRRRAEPRAVVPQHAAVRARGGARSRRDITSRPTGSASRRRRGLRRDAGALFLATLAGPLARRAGRAVVFAGTPRRAAGARARVLHAHVRGRGRPVRRVRAALVALDRAHRAVALDDGDLGRVSLRARSRRERRLPFMDGGGGGGPRWGGQGAYDELTAMAAVYPAAQTRGSGKSPPPPPPRRPVSVFPKLGGCGGGQRHRCQSPWLRCSSPGHGSGDLAPGRPRVIDDHRGRRRPHTHPSPKSAPRARR